jgi:hypothetical protein
MLKSIQSTLLNLYKNYPEVVPVMFLWICIQLAGIITRAIWPIDHEYAGYPWLREDGTLGNYFFNLTQTWDSIHYSRLGTLWYAPIDHIGNKDYIYAFFPLYPAVIGVIGWVVGITSSMVAMSLVLPCIAAVLLKRIFKQLFPTIDSTILVTTSFLLPFSLFFFVPYTESLYLILLCSIIGFVYKTHSKWLNLVLGLTFGIVVVLNRSVGLLFTGSFFLVFFVQTIFEWFKFKKVDAILIDRLIKSFWLGLGSLIGIVGFFVHNWIRTGNFLVSRTVQDYFGRGSTLNPLDPFVRGFNQTVSGERFSRGLLFVPIILGLLWYVSKWVSKKYPEHKWLMQAGLLYTILTVYLNITANSLASTNRYILTSPIYFIGLPVFITLVLQKRSSVWLKVLWIACFIFLLFSMAIFSRQLWLG